MEFLEGFDYATAGLIHRLNTTGSCLGSGDSGDIRHLFLDGGFPQIAVIRCLIGTDGSVNDQIHLAVYDQIVDIGTTFIQLVNKLRENARISQSLLISLVRTTMPITWQCYS